MMDSFSMRILKLLVTNECKIGVLLENNFVQSARVMKGNFPYSFFFFIFINFNLGGGGYFCASCY